MNKNKNSSQLLEWASNVLNVHNTTILIQTPWSVVIKIEANQNGYYLKQTPADLFIEPDIIRLIQENMPGAHVPKVLFKNDTLHCFLMNSCGDYSLRTKFNGSLDKKLLLQGLHVYTKIMRNLEQKTNDFLMNDVPDWRIEHLSELYSGFLEKREMLLDEGLTPDEIDKLIKLVPTIESICQSLAKSKIKETLVNCDFNENNMIMNESTKQIAIIDWGESVISHPFFSVASHLQSIARRYQLALQGEELKWIKQQWLSCWSDVADEKALEEIYQHILRLHPVFSAMSTYRLQTATNNTSKTMQRWFIGDALKLLL